MLKQVKKIKGGNEFLDAAFLLKNKLGVFYGAQAADLGCGASGYFVFKLAELVGKEGHVYAVDVLKLVLKNIEHRASMLGYNNISTLWSNLEAANATLINNNSLDFALLVNVLFQNTQHGKIIQEAARMLKRGGKLLIVDWEDGRFPFGPPPEIKVSPAKLTDLALGAGLKKQELFEAGRYHYGLLLVKI